MSHAAVIVSPTREHIAALGIEQAIAWEMEPFDERGQWFRDGSRWDWYSIGGRYTGSLDGYEPEHDQRNVEVCKLCCGTGIRPNGIEEFGQAWSDACNGCNGCSGTGKRQKWPTEWHKHPGDRMQVKLFDASKFSGASAFLRDRHWHESERLGWFGGMTATECERKNPGDPDKVFGKCLHKDEETGARIICWNEPWEIWKEHYAQRFIKPLNIEETIIVVDYHI